MDIKFIIKDFVACRGDVQRFAAHRYKSFIETGPYEPVVKYVITDQGAFAFDKGRFRHELDTIRDYELTDFRPDDIVLDIGAYVGGFTFKVAPMVKHVYAAEPLFYRELVDNVGANKRFLGVGNVTPLCYALGDKTNLEYEDKASGNVESKTLSELIEMCGGRVDFLKCDCEGGEWNIRPHELDGIRRIEIEVHVTKDDKAHKHSQFYHMLRDAGFSVKTSLFSDECTVYHAKRENT